MSVQFTLKLKETFVLVLCGGDYDKGDFEDMLHQSLQAAVSQDVSKILFDARNLTGELSVVDFYELGKLVSEVTGEHHSYGIQMAFVASDSFLDPKRFGETVAKNRGIRGIVTSEIGEALRCLDIEQDYGDTAMPE